MTLEELNRRKIRVNDASELLRIATLALEHAREEYAEQEANKAGIFYGKTKVAFDGGEFFVSGRDTLWYERPFYELAYIKCDGTMSNTGPGLAATLDDLTIITDESETT